MWNQTYVPIADNLAAAAALAALPIFVLLLALGVFRLAAWKSALLGLASAAVTAVALYGMPIKLLLSSAGYGAAFGLFPIAWIVFWAVALYRLTVETGQFAIIRASLGR